MSIIINKKGKKAEKIDKAFFERESQMQEYIQENPDAIPIYQLKSDKKLLVGKREFSTNAGPIDALAIDKDGDIYIIETKLFKNPDKRTVVAQALDYGAALWKHMNDFNVFIKILDDEMKKRFNLNFREKTKEFYDLDDEQVDYVFEKIKNNLDEGVLKFVVLMDTMNERLKDLILYVNQNSQFDIYAVQMDYYKFQDYEIIIPKLFGVEVKKNISIKSVTQRKKWDENLFFEEAGISLNKDYFNKIKRIYDFSVKLGEIKWGSGVSKGSFNVCFPNINERSIFTIWTDGKLSINYGWLNKKKENGEIDWSHLEDFCKKLQNNILNEMGLDAPNNYRTHYVNYSVDEWVDKADAFIEIIKKMIK